MTLICYGRIYFPLKVSCFLSKQWGDPHFQLFTNIYPAPRMLLM